MRSAHLKNEEGRLLEPAFFISAWPRRVAPPPALRDYTLHGGCLQCCRQSRNNQRGFLDGSDEADPTPVRRESVGR